MGAHEGTGDERAQIEEERRKRQSLDGSYLSQAINELRASGSSDRLFPRHDLPKTDPRRVGFWIAASKRLGEGRRREFARASTLYSILAAEAYANEYLQFHLSNEEFRAADRLPTFDKYLLGPRLVSGQSLLDRGGEPAQTLKKLLAHRTKLVHPKLRPTEPDDRGESIAEDLSPYDAARYLVAVSDAAGWLLANSKPSHFDWTIAVVDMERDVFLEYGRLAADRLPEVTDDPAPDLLFEAMTRSISVLREKEQGPEAHGG